MIVVGLTGSIGMGKSTTAQFFKDRGLWVWDADAAVHDLYAKGGKAVEPIGKAFCNVIIEGAVDRGRLMLALKDTENGFARLEDIVHPLVFEHRQAFLNDAKRQNQSLVVLDIPLLFETGASKYVDYIVVVTAPHPIQKDRVLSRPGMTLEKFEAILARQVPDHEKQKQADLVIDTSLGLDAARQAVHGWLDSLCIK